MNRLFEGCRRGRLWRMPAVAVAYLLLATAAGAAAAPGIGGNFVISAGDGFHSAPAIAVNPTGPSFLVAWTSTGPNPADPSVSVSHVEARVVSPGGGALLSERIIVSQGFESDVTLGGSSPAVAYNGVDNEFLVVYERRENQSIDPGIYAQRVGSDGGRRGGEIAVFRASAQTAPTLAYDSTANRYLVAWNGLGNINTLGVVLENDGQPLGPVAQMGPLGQVTRNPALAHNGDVSRYLLALEASVATASAVEARLLDSNGLFVSNTVSVSPASGAQTAPSVVVSGSQFLVAWSDGGTGLRAQLVNGDGSLAGGNVSLRNNAASPVIAYSNLRKRYLAAWVEAASGSANNGFLMGQFLQPSLVSRGAAFRISETSTVSGRPAVSVYQPDSLGLAVWSRRFSSASAAIWGQLIDLSTQFATLSLAVTPSPKSVSAGAQLTYNIRVRNQSAVTGKGVSLSDTLPAGASLVSATPSTGTCSEAGGTVSCDLGNLAQNTAATVSLVVTPSRLGTGNNRAVLDWSNNAGNPVKVSTKVKVSYPGRLTLVAPDGGEILAAGSPFDVVWDLQGGVPGDVVNYRLEYSLNGGKSWKRVASGLQGTIYRWMVPAVASNQGKSLVRVTGFSQDKRQIGSARSAKPFTIEVVRMVTPVAGEVANGGHVLNIAWDTHATKKPVWRAQLAYSLDGGKAWKKLATVEGNPGSYAWTVPPLAKASSRSRVRVVLKGASGATLGSAVSATFTLLP